LKNSIHGSHRKGGCLNFKDMNNTEIESPEVIKAIINVYKSVDNELQQEHMRSKKNYLEKYNLREIKTNTPRTALES
jgi:retron-type reverse transcriptase